MQLRESSQPPSGGEDKRPHSVPARTDETPGSKIVCTACRALVTSTAARIDVAGAHRHERVNPGGYVFTIGCFGLAPGCAPMGVPSSDFAWFPRYEWQVGLCRGCRAHLGWRFSSSDDAFYGLRLDAVVEVEEPEA